MSYYKKAFTAANRNSRIVTKKNGSKTVTTKPTGRDEGTMHVEIRSKKAGNGDTRLFIRDQEGEYLAFNGFEARTLYRTLQRHYEETDKTW